MRKFPNWRTELEFAIAGAVIATVIELLVQRPVLEDINWLSLVTATVVGAVLGWIFDLARGFHLVLADAVLHLDTLSKALEYQKSALDTLLKDKRHSMVLHELIKDSIQNNFKHIPFVHVNTYFGYLKKALEQSDDFDGVHDKPVRYFKEQASGADYLQKIRSKTMRRKRRVFIIDDIGSKTAKDEMEEDLKNPEIMNFYWKNTGSDMKTFWILRSIFENNYPRLDKVPGDFALFDNQLLIIYDKEYSIVTFEIIEQNSDELKIFEAIDKQIAEKSLYPFTQILPDIKSTVEP